MVKDYRLDRSPLVEESPKLLEAPLKATGAHQGVLGAIRARCGLGGVYVYVKASALVCLYVYLDPSCIYLYL